MRILHDDLHQLLDPFMGLTLMGEGMLQRILEDPAEICTAITAIAEKYSPDYKEGIPEEINSSMASLCIVEITIDHLTGKEAIELVRARNNH